MIGRLDDFESCVGPTTHGFTGHGRIGELIVGRGEDEFGSRVLGGEDPPLGHGEGRGDGDPTVHAGLDHVQSDHRTERIPGDPRVIVGDHREEVDRGGDVEPLGISVVMFATTRSHAPEVEAKAMESEIGQMFEERLDDRVESVASIERVGMGEGHRTPDVGRRRSEVGHQLDSVDGRECHRAVGHGTTVP